MKRPKQRKARGFALIACLMLLFLMSVLSIGLMLRVQSEASVGGNDLQNNIAFHGAEGAMEKMTSDLSQMFTSIQAPQVGDYTNLSTLVPTMSGITFPEYTVTPNTDPITGQIKSSFGQITTGPNQGLYAELIPITLSVTAQSGLANQVRMVRTVDVALIPVFQFGVFSQGDLGFFASPDLDFNGRVHTNGDLYLGVSNGSTITFHDKVTAYGNVIRMTMPNGLAAPSYNDNGTVDVLSAAGGCNGAQPACRALAQNQGSVVGGPTSAQNSTWQTTSLTTYNSWIIDGNYGASTGTGATCLSLPFTVGSINCPTGPGQPPSAAGPQTYEIVRRPPTGESLTSAIGQARLYNEAQIRVLLADDPSELPGGAADANNIRLANVQTNGTAPDYSHGVPASVPSGLPATHSGQPYVTYFAEASTAIEDPSAWTNSSTQFCLPADWSVVPTTPAPTSAGYTLANYENLPVSVSNPQAAVFTTPATGYAPYISTNNTAVAPPACFGTAAQNAALKNVGPATLAPSPPTTWNLVDGYIRVDYKDNTGAWNPVTQEWLELGFARGVNPPTNASPNAVHPHAILVFQQIADRNGDGVIDATGAAGATSGSGSTQKIGISKPPDVQKDSDAGNSYYYGDKGDTTSPTRYNWYPINFYDAREGEPRDLQQTGGSAGSCTANGVMNVVELDMANLQDWLLGETGANGTKVNWSAANGYILYFSDHRGMLSNPTAGRKTGDSGLEDVINSASTTGANDGVLESPTGTGSPEDVNINGVLDNYGATNLGLGFGINGTINVSPPNYYVRMNTCLTTARRNWVSGARHVLRLVDGSLGNVPTKPDGTGGFTVASDNPVYILGDYNTSAADPTWTGGAEPAHSAAGIIADAVTVLSNSWSDGESLGTAGKRPTVASDRTASTTYYRVAIAAGKNRTFPAPSYTQNGTLYGFGTDGGVHNFLKFIEDWSSSTLNYKGSLVSLYYSTYATGTFKCCAYAVYQPPTRNYVFDPLFTNPQNLPPGTPMFRDVNNLSYRQDFTPR